MSFVIDEQHSMREVFPNIEGKRFLIRAVAYIIDVIIIFGLTLNRGLSAV